MQGEVIPSRQDIFKISCEFSCRFQSLDALSPAVVSLDVDLNLFI